MSDMIDTLQQLQQLRQRSLNQVTSQLTQQKQLCQRYQRNINALNALTLSEEAFPGVSALQMANHAGYQRHIQRLIDWQKQEQALAEIEVGNLQTQMQQQARREKIVAVVLEQQQEEYQREQGRLAQKNTDALATQCWQRQQAGDI